MLTNNKKLEAKIAKIKNRTIFGRGTPIETKPVEVVKDESDTTIRQDNSSKGKRTKSTTTESVSEKSHRDKVDASEVVRKS